MHDKVEATLADIYNLARHASLFNEGDDKDVKFVAAHFSLIDSMFAIDDYKTIVKFKDFRQAYLMKFGLLQALHNEIKAVEAIADTTNFQLRLDRLPGVASVLLARHIVAGHPIDGNMQGSSWRHFQDRASVAEPELIKVMSFNKGDPKNWTGQGIIVAKLIHDTEKAVTDGLNKTLINLQK